MLKRLLSKIKAYFIAWEDKHIGIANKPEQVVVSQKFIDDISRYIYKNYTKKDIQDINVKTDELALGYIYDNFVCDIRKPFSMCPLERKKMPEIITAIQNLDLIEKKLELVVEELEKEPEIVRLTKLERKTFLDDLEYYISQTYTDEELEEIDIITAIDKLSDIYMEFSTEVDKTYIKDYPRYTELFTLAMNHFIYQAKRRL